MIKSSFDFYVAINGRKVTEYLTDSGDTYIEGRKGSAYELVFKNLTPYTKKIVVSVDGLNVITGNRDWKRGYVIKPYNQMSIPGFKRDNNRAAAFTFSSLKDSYNQHNVSGEVQNIGVLGCMVFDEIVPQPEYYSNQRGLNAGFEHWNYPNINSSVTKGVSGEPNQAYSVNSLASMASSSSSVEPLSYSVNASIAPSLGTEFGNDVEFKTRTVNRNFQQTATAMLTLYYDDANGLTKRGIVLKRTEPAKPNPFPGFEYYCPDPIK